MTTQNVTPVAQQEGTIRLEVRRWIEPDHGPGYAIDSSRQIRAGVVNHLLAEFGYWLLDEELARTRTVRVISERQYVRLDIVTTRQDHIDGTLERKPLTRDLLLKAGTKNPPKITTLDPPDGASLGSLPEKSTGNASEDDGSEAAEP